MLPKEVKSIKNGINRIHSIYEHWGIVGQYKNESPKDANGRYKIALGPEILMENYPDNGKVWEEEFNYSTYIIKIFLVHKQSNEEKVIEGIIRDIKANSYNKYPDGHAVITGDNVKYEIKSGIMQTGIRYPNSSSASSYVSDCEDSSIVEFCTESYKMDFKPFDYHLKKLIVTKYSIIKK